MARTKLYPPSVDPGFPTLSPTPSGWTRMTFGDVVEPVERPVALDPTETYRLLTAKRSRGGIVLRGELLGREILTKTQFEAKAGDFLISRRQIIHGACGLVPDDLDGAVVSNEYSTLKPRKRLLLDFLAHYSHTSYFQRTCFHSSHGVDVEKMIFKIDEWLRREVDVPPVAEQRKIAAILSSVDASIAATQAVIDQLQVVKKAMMAELLTRGLPGRHRRFKHTEIGDAPASWQVMPLGDVLNGIDAGWSPQCQSEPAGPHEWGVLKVSAVSWGEFRPAENKKLPQSLEPRTEAEVQPGDVLLSRANTPDLVGRSVLVRGTRPRLMLSDKILRLRPHASLVDGKYLNLVLASESSRAQIVDGATGSSRSMKNISQEKLRSVRIPVPSREEASAITALVDAVALRVAAECECDEVLKLLRSALSTALLTGDLRVPTHQDPTP